MKLTVRYGIPSLINNIKIRENFSRYTCDKIDILFSNKSFHQYQFLHYKSTRNNLGLNQGHKVSVRGVIA